MYLSVSNVESVWMIMIPTMNYVRPFLNNIIFLLMSEGCKVRIFLNLALKGWKVIPFQGQGLPQTPTKAYKLLDP